MLTTVHLQALLQFDMKNTLEQVGQCGLDHFADRFADHFANRCGAVIISGADIPLIRALVERIPELKRGYDPTNDLLALWPDLGLAEVERALTQVLRYSIKPDMAYLNCEMLLTAASLGLDMIALAQAEGVAVDASTHTVANPTQGFSDAEWGQFSALMALKPDQITTDEPTATEVAWDARVAL